MSYVILENELGEYAVAEIKYVPAGRRNNRQVEEIIKIGFKDLEEAENYIDRLERTTTGHRVE